MNFNFQFSLIAETMFKNWITSVIVEEKKFEKRSGQFNLFLQLCRIGTIIFICKMIELAEIEYLVA